MKKNLNDQLENDIKHVISVLKKEGYVISDYEIRHLNSIKIDIQRKDINEKRSELDLNKL